MILWFFKCWIFFSKNWLIFFFFFLKNLIFKQSNIIKKRNSTVFLQRDKFFFYILKKLKFQNFTKKTVFFFKFLFITRKLYFSSYFFFDCKWCPIFPEKFLEFQQQKKRKKMFCSNNFFLIIWIMNKKIFRSIFSYFEFFSFSRKKFWKNAPPFQKTSLSHRLPTTLSSSNPEFPGLHRYR